MKKETTTSKRLREAINNAAITQQELSDKSGVPKASISQYINGHYIPSNEAAGKMAKILKVNPAWLMGFEVSKIPDVIDFDKLNDEGIKHLKAYYDYLLKEFKKEDN